MVIIPRMRRSSLSKRLLFGAGAVTAALTATAAVHACSNQTPVSAKIEDSEMQAIIRAVFANDRLWLMHDDGSLASLRPDQAEPERVSTPGKLVDICKSGGRLVAIVDDGHNHWNLQQRSPEGWAVWASVRSEGDALAAIDCRRDDVGITVVTNRRLLEVDGKTVRSVKLKEELQPPFVNGTALAAGDAVWVGFNVGEWGGGLRRITRTDGTVESIEENRSGDLCGGPLNTACDPVNGIVVAPWNPSCVVAAIGLVHFMAHGRIIEVCGKDVQRLYFKALDPQPPGGTLDDGEPSSTIPFFGLNRTNSTLWAVGVDGLYRFDGKRAPEFRPLPDFEKKGGYWVSFEVPGITLVRTDVNQRRSLSGSVPIMAVR